MKFQCIKYHVANLLPFTVRSRIKKYLAHKRRKRQEKHSSRLEEIRTLLTYIFPINLIPPATGKLRLLQDGNTVLMAHIAKVSEENNLRYWMDYGTLLGAVGIKGSSLGMTIWTCACCVQITKKW